MDAALYVKVLEETLLPFLRDIYPDGHRFMADNAPKHTSALARQFLEENNVTWWRTPAESPDLNPIENLWHELKEHNCREVKPQTKQELVDAFWDSVDIPKCVKYIRHLRKVCLKLLSAMVQLLDTDFISMCHIFLMCNVHVHVYTLLSV